MSGPFVRLTQNPVRVADNRGALEIFYENGDIALKRSFSRKGVFRGMHIQPPPHEQTKLIRVVSGRIIDFLLEPDGAQYRVHHREIDSTADWLMIGAQFAHGFYALEDTVFEYVCDGAYNPSAEKAYSIVEFLEARMGIREPILSEKDRAAPRLGLDVLKDAGPDASRGAGRG
jgi:dTDP-4-dehydrorhamnose 3,5-epimerase